MKRAHALGMPSLFDVSVDPEVILRPEPVPARRADPPTSVAAGRSVRLRAGSQKAVLLLAYAAASGGLTDDEAAEAAGLLQKPGACWWHRCSDLRSAGLVAPTGEHRMGRAGELRMVCAITGDGRSLAAALA